MVSLKKQHKAARPGVYRHIDGIAVVLCGYGLYVRWGDYPNYN
jgi:hypothetical protein